MRLATMDYTASNAAAIFNRSMRETGFAIVVNHPIATGLIRGIYDEWLAFFATDAKHRYVDTTGRLDGFFPYPGESAGGPIVRDRKEFFHVYSGGCYPMEVSDAALRYLHEARTLAHTLLAWLDERGPAEVTRHFVMSLARMVADSSPSVLRIQHYLPLRGDELADAPRALPHTDINLLTLLPAPSGRGLQIFQTDGGWQDVASDPQSLIINVGEMLQLASGGYYRAALHRVMKPAGTEARDSRMSMPLFVHPADDVTLAPDCTATEFRAARVAEMHRRGWNVVAGGARPQVQR